MDLKDKIFEFRCSICNSLLCKTKITSNIELKCKKCKKMNYFLSGTSSINDNNKIFN